MDFWLFKYTAQENQGLNNVNVRSQHIWQDYSLNMEEVKDLTKTFQPDLVIIESGGDNLAANYSRELADYIIYVIDVAGKNSK